MEEGPDQDPNGPKLPTDAELAAYDDEPDPLDALAVDSDEDAVKQFGKRTKPFTKVVLLLMVLLLGAVAVLIAVTESQRAADDEALERINAMEDLTQVAAELRILLGQTSHPDTKERVMRNLGRFKDEAAVPLIIEQLGEAGQVRRAAALALAEIGLPAAESAKQRLFEELADTDELDRAAVIWALAVLREDRAADEIIAAFSSGRLQQNEAFEPKIITDVLGPSRLASDELFTHDSEAVRLLTAQALAEAASPEVVEPLSRLIATELRRPANGEASVRQSTEVIRAAAAGLGRTGDPRGAQKLFELLQSHPDQQNAVVTALRNTTAAPEIAALLAHADAGPMRLELIRLLAATHDDRVADALAGALSDADENIRRIAALALADFGDARAADTLLAIAGGPNDGQADEALHALHYLGSEHVADKLLELLPACPAEPGPDMPPGCFRRATILRALGATGVARVGRRIETALDTVDGPSAAIALATLNHEAGYRKLLRLAARPRDIDMTATEPGQRELPNEDLLRARRGAIMGLGRYGRPEASDALMSIVEDEQDDYELRALAASGLGLVASDETIQTVIAKIQDEEVNEAARRYYVRALWQKPRQELNAQLLELVASQAPRDVRRAAALAIGYSGDATVDTRLVQLLGNEATVREAAFAIGLAGAPAAVQSLMETLASDSDTEEILRNGIAGQDTTWFDMLTAEMFESGQIWRRLTAARVLADGDGNHRYGQAWFKVIEVLKTGWDGLDGLTPPAIRRHVWEALGGPDADRRQMAARVLAELSERGLLLRARDGRGPGADEARAQLRRMNRPGST